MPTYRSITYNNHIYTLKALAATLKLSDVTIRRILRRKEGTQEENTVTDEDLPKRSYKSRGLTYNGRPASVQDIMDIANVSEGLVTKRIKMYGLNLTSQHMHKLPTTNKAAPTSRIVNEGKQSLNSPEERAKLAKIPTPTSLEYELWK